MSSSFFANPLWRRFHNRPIWVVSLSDLEHRLRDARALIDLQEFLPPRSSGRCTYHTITLGDHGHPVSQWPAIPADAGVVIIGRPALFGPEIAHQIEHVWTPSLGFQFESNDPQTGASYRSIKAIGTDSVFKCPLWGDQRAKRPPPAELFDYGIVYCGWNQERPVMLLSGTGTAGTWGCVKFVTDPPSPYDLRWQQEVQGVIRASVDNINEAYQSVRAEAHERQMLSPCRIWMEGKDLPSPDGWKDPNSLCLDERRRHTKFDLRVSINGHPVFQNSRTHLGALVLLALVGRREGRREFPGGIHVHATTTEVLRGLYDFLRPKAMTYGEFRDRYNPNVLGLLRALIQQTRDNGGIADVLGGKAARFGICVRPLPPFLPIVS